MSVPNELLTGLVIGAAHKPSGGRELTLSDPVWIRISDRKVDVIQFHVCLRRQAQLVVRSRESMNFVGVRVRLPEILLWPTLRKIFPIMVHLLTFWTNDGTSGLFSARSSERQV